jgi:ubiquitin-conjugating enzyme E2 M
MFQLGQTSKNSRIARESGVVKKNSGQLRISKDVSELDAPPSIAVSFPNPDDLMNISLALAPQDGFYAAGIFHFTVSIPEDYPHSPPKVHCNTPIYHPNIDIDGNVCLNILRQDWKPVLTLSAVLYGLQLLFLEPNPDDPLNKDAADVLKRDKHSFRRNVDTSIRGGIVGGRHYMSCRR